MSGDESALKLNLGCGSWKVEGFLNVDSEPACEPDLVWDLEKVPWPFEDSCSQEILMSHVLEHLGREPESYLAIVRELYRVARPGANVFIVVPHPRHDSFLTDPTHVRPITADGLRMFSKRLNRKWIEEGASNTPLGVYLDVDFEVVRVKNYFDEHWERELTEGRIGEPELEQLARAQNNVIRETAIVLEAIK